MNATPISPEVEAAIRQLVQDMQDGQNSKDGELFASAFAQEPDYVAINDMFLPNQTQRDNARMHQRLYDDRRSSVVGKYGEVELWLKVSKIGLLTPQVAVVHLRGVFRPKGQAEKKAETIMTAVMRKREDRWEIVSFHNAPVQKRQEEEAGFVIRIEGVDAHSEGVGSKAMIKDVPQVGIFVNDQEAALEFYTDKLGLEKVQDEPYGEGGARWINGLAGRSADQDRPEEGRARPREGHGWQLRRGAGPDARHR